MESARIQKKGPCPSGAEEMDKRIDYKEALSSGGIPGTVVMHIGAKVDELYSGYALTAKMPDGRLLFRGPCFLEGRYEDTGAVKLAALGIFLRHAENVFGKYGDGLKLFLWSSDEKLNESWRLHQETQNACGAAPSPWDPVLRCLEAHDSVLEVVGPAN